MHTLTHLPTRTSLSGTNVILRQDCIKPDLNRNRKYRRQRDCGFLLASLFPGSGTQGGVECDGEGRSPLPSHRPSHNPRDAHPQQDGSLGRLHPSVVAQTFMQIAAHQLPPGTRWVHLLPSLSLVGVG